MDAIKNRRSVREFDLNKKINYDSLMELCRYAEAAPTARNQRSREYFIIDDAMLIQKLSTISKGAMVLQNCSAVLAVLARNPEEISTPQMQDQDLACAVENILIAATSMGIGSCYIGIHPLKDRIEACDQILALPKEIHTFALVALGYPLKEDAFYDKDKWDISLCHHNKY